MLWQITSSPAFTPSNTSARCNPAVPELNAATWQSLFRNSSRSCSKPFTFGPSGAIQFVSKASFTYCSSVPPICGDDNHIFGFIIPVLLLLLFLRGCPPQLHGQV